MRFRSLLLLAAPLALCACPDSSTTQPTPPPPPPPTSTPGDDGPDPKPSESAQPKPSESPQNERRTRRTYEAKIKLSGPGLAQQSTYEMVMVRQPKGKGERIALEVPGQGGLELGLDERGEITVMSDPVLGLVMQTIIEAKGLKQRNAPRNLYLPDGGWIRQEHKVGEAPEPLKFGDNACIGTQVKGRFQGQRASGEPFKGEIRQFELWHDQETFELIALRAKFRIILRDHGPRQFLISVLPKAEPEGDLPTQKPWLDAALSDPLARELGMPLIGSFLQASAVGTAAKVNPELWGSQAVFTASLATLVAKVQALPGQLESGKVVELREEPARTVITYWPTPRGIGLDLVPTALTDDADRIVKIEGKGRTRAVYVDAATYGSLKEGQPFDVGSNSGVESHSRGPASQEDADALAGADDQGKAVIER